MIGPFDRMFGNGPFDLNHDGIIDAGETAYINDVLFPEKIYSESDEENLRDEIEFLDPDERRKVIENMGYDPDDFDDDFDDDF